MNECHNNKFIIMCCTEMGNLFEITQYLNDLNNEQLVNLGGALGLHFPTLRRMNDLPNEMVAAWLRGRPQNKW